MPENDADFWSKEFKLFNVEVLKDGAGFYNVTIRDNQNPWKYYVDTYSTPKETAKDLRRIADWLEKQ